MHVEGGWLASANKKMTGKQEYEVIICKRNGGQVMSKADGKQHVIVIYGVECALLLSLLILIIMLPPDKDANNISILTTAIAALDMTSTTITEGETYNISTDCSPITLSLNGL